MTNCRERSDFNPPPPQPHACAFPVPLRAPSGSCLPDITKAPVVELESKDLPYGECFVRFHEPRTLVLLNTSEALTGLFRVVPQNPATFHVARVSPEPEQGQVKSIANPRRRRATI